MRKSQSKKEVKPYQKLKLKSILTTYSTFMLKRNSLKKFQGGNTDISAQILRSLKSSKDTSKLNKLQSI